MMMTCAGGASDWRDFYDENNDSQVLIKNNHFDDNDLCRWSE